MQLSRARTYIPGIYSTGIDVHNVCTTPYGKSVVEGGSTYLASTLGDRVKIGWVSIIICCQCKP